MCLSCMHGFLPSLWVLLPGGLYWQCKSCRMTIDAEDYLTTLRCAQLTDKEKEDAVSPLEQREHDEQMSKQAVAPIMKAWDDLVIPAPTTDSMEDYIDELKDVVRDLARQVNTQEGIAQTLAEANVRQTKLVSQLRTEITRLKLERMTKELASCPDLHGGQDAA